MSLIADYLVDRAQMSILSEVFLPVIDTRLTGASQILDHLYLGDCRSALDQQKLVDYQITHIVRVGVDHDIPIFPGIKYLDLPLPANGLADLHQDIRLSYPFIHEALERGESVLVHGQNGISRSAAQVIGYLMKSQPTDVLTAHQQVSQRRPTVCLNIGLYIALHEIESEMTGMIRLPGCRVTIIDEEKARWYVRQFGLGEWDLTKLERPIGCH